MNPSQPPQGGTPGAKTMTNPHTIENDSRTFKRMRDATKAARHQARRDSTTVAIFNSKGQAVRWVSAAGDLVDAAGRPRGY